VSRIRPTDLSDIVFSIVEYLRAASRPYAWHHIFADDFEAAPFLVVGARLADEFDLAEILRRGNHARSLTGRPSLVVLRDIDDLQREEFTSWGLLPVEATAQDFFERLGTDVRHYEAEFAAQTPGDPRRLENEAARFLSQFQRLRVDPRLRATPGHDLYSGHDPEWQDILGDLDARFDVVRRIVERLSGLLSGDPSQSVTALFGPPFSGKSVCLYRVARELLRGAVDVYLFDGEDRLDVEATAWWLSHDDQVVLMFDGAADYAGDLARLASLCEAKRVRMIAFVAERESRTTPLYSQLPPTVLSDAGTWHLSRLSNREVHALVTKLADAGRLGRITDRDRRGREDYFKVESGRQLVEGMARLESGAGFIDRLESQYQSITDPALRAAYGIACLSYALGYSIPVPILATSAGVSAASLIAALEHDQPLSEVMQLTGRRIRPRHRRLASIVVEQVLGAADRYELSLALARNLSPYITPATISQRTLPYRIGRELMSARIIGDWIGVGEADGWYAELLDVYDWNARYWEQRALASARAGVFDRAESFAANGVRVRRDAFTLTTLGSVLLRKSHLWATPGSDGSWDFYWRGVEALRDAALRAEGRVELPYLAFFQNTLELAEKIRSPIDPQVLAEWAHWDTEASDIQLFAHSEFRNQLQDFRQRWMLLATRRSSE
jgi:hypothetical protein